VGGCCASGAPVALAALPPSDVGNGITLDSNGEPMVVGEFGPPVIEANGLR
jgi:hypothetical protein